jgi:hypothetical protein
MKKTVLRICVLAAALAASHAAAQEQPTPAPQPPRALAPLPSGRSVMFHVALILADSEPAKTPAQTLPPGIKKAIGDVLDFLPFKSYRLYDSALVRAGSRVSVNRLDGPDGTYTVSFTVSEEGTHDGSLLVDHFALTRVRTQPLPPGVAPRAEEPLASSFRIRTGETVVVGSSSLSGGKALIAILSALP